MKRLPLFITIGFLLVTVGGYYVYDRFLTHKNKSAWDLVPETTIFVYETNDCKECVDQLQQTSLWSIFRQAAFYGKSTDSLSLLFDLVDLQPKGQLISAHQTRKDDFDFVFYIPLGKAKNKNLLLEAWSTLKSKEREFNGIKIHELITKGQSFSWTQIDNIWVGSFTPFLIEDVIRTYTSGEDVTFRKKIASVYRLPRVKKDAGNLYVHIKNFGTWLNTFSTDSPDIVQHIGQSSILDIKTDERNFVMNGFSLDSASQGYVLSVFNDQTPVPFNLKNLISNRSITVASYGVSDGLKFGEALKKYTSQKKPSLLDSVKQLNASGGVALEKLYESLGKEIGVCVLEAKDKGLTKVVLVETTKPQEWLKTFNVLAQKNSVDTVFFERFSEYEIREVPLYAFPEKLFWPLVSGLTTCYYTSLGNTIIMGEKVDDLKQFLDDIDKEETWGKSVAQNKFLETTLLEANLNLFIHTPMVWSLISESLHPRWKKFVEENQSALQTIGMGAVQMSHLNNSYYTNITWTFGEKKDVQPSKKETNTNKVVTTFPQGIHKFSVIRNHHTKEDEVLVQDSSRALSLVSSEGKVRWSVALDHFITGDVAQVDLFKNGKLQFFFATPGQLHIIDRLGKYVNPYPVSIPEKDIEFTSIIDYDHSKKYRFLITSKAGKLWMYDKDGRNLEGWNPKLVDGNIFTAPQHHRIRGKDYVLAVREDGVANLMSRRGETIKNFPLNLDARPVGDYVLEAGNSIETTYFVLVSRDGFRIKFNLNGKIQSRESLIKTSPDARFKLVRELTDKSYLVIRQESRQLTVMDNNLKEIIASDFIENNLAEVRYYNFGGGKIYTTLTDLSQDLSFIYDAQGKLVTTLPLESNDIGVRSDDQKIKVYSGFNNSLTLQSF